MFANVVFDLGNSVEKYVLCEFVADKNTDMSTLYSGSSGVFDVSADFDNGAVVEVITGNNYIGQFTVSSGNVDVSAVDNTLHTAEIGFNFDVNLITNPIDAPTAGGPLTGIPRGVTSVFLDLNNTLSASVNGTNLIIRNVNDDLSLQQQPLLANMNLDCLDIIQIHK